jgi:L-ascorbate metabolism protein UlaG (beta-lactamase superfamily)
MILERMGGRFQLGDVAITGWADKHQCTAPGWYSWTNAIAEGGAQACPPGNPMHMDNVIYIVETGGLRIAHWGDNRPVPDERVLKALEGVDVLIMNIDGSQHILSYAQIDTALARIKPRVVIPAHYLTKGASTTLTTLRTADEWVDRHGNATRLTSGSLELRPEQVKSMNQHVMYFGSNFVKN